MAIASSLLPRLTGRFRFAKLSLLLVLCIGRVCIAQTGAEPGWPTYGGDAGGQRYSAAAQINRDNVSRLHHVWTYHTHALDSHRPGYLSAAFETTPVLFHDTLYLSTPFSDIKAIDPATGAEKWSYTATTNADFDEGDLDTSRGVATWQGPASEGPICRARVFVGTLKGAIHAVDADSGKPCDDFGVHGVVNLRAGMTGVWFGMTSAPTVVGDVLIAGSTMPDNYEAMMPSGAVRGFDVHTGKLLWAWEPISLPNARKMQTGAANAWSTISADPALGLVYVPTGSASPDFYGGQRLGDDRDADSVVALDAKTGKKVWAFQVVHHNLWDYDVPSEPLLFMLHGNIPAVAVTTKMGMVFVLDRRTGEPLYPVEERPVPQTDVPGERTSPTQPISSLPPFAPLEFTQAGNGTGWQRSARNIERCRALLSGLRYEGMYTPPSERGSLIFPGNIGGVNWGGPALDPATNMIYANTNRVAYSVYLVRRSWRGSWEGSVSAFIRMHTVKLVEMMIFSFLFAIGAYLLNYRGLGTALVVLAVVTLLLVFPWQVLIPRQMAVMHMMEGAFGHDTSPMFGSPFELRRDPIKDYDGMPCNAPPWGGLTAINLETGKKEWEKPLGTMAPGGPETGSLNLGGPAVTAGGLVFAGATRDAVLRAFDSKTGEIVWKTDLPAPAQATPMSYVYKGKQYVVIAAGGHGLFGTKTGDSVVAFALE